METTYFTNLLKEFNAPLHDPVLVFSVILMIILFSPILLRKLRIPSIIGLIISGLVLGPHGINLLEKNSAIDLFSTIGLLYIMFIAGLELDMNEFRKNKNKSIIFGFLSFTVPFIFGFIISKYFFDYEWNACLLIASLFSTHTMVSYPIISKYGLSKNEAVAITVGGTILTDTAVLIILAINLSSVQGELNSDFWIRMGISLTAFLLIMFYVIPRIAKWFFMKLESEKTSHYIFVLSVVFLAAFLAKIAGLEPIIGAFAAGLALNRLIPHSSSLMNRIEFIGNAIFIPFFLISVGMIVDLRVFLHGTTAIIIAVIFTIVALTSKWFAAAITQVLFKYSHSQRQLIFGLSSSHAAAILAVALVGYNSNIIDENILNSTIVIILITCIVASFVTDKVSRQIVLESKNEEDKFTTAKKKNYEHILLPLANFSNMENLLDFASMLKNKKSVNPITILSVVPNDKEAEINLQKAKENLDSLVKIASASETHVNVVATIDHNIASGIVRTSKEIMADIILLGWPRKSSLVDKFIGERTETILNDTDKNIFLCCIEKLLISSKRIVLLAPPFSEMENGFESWLNKTILLAHELSLGISCTSNKETRDEIETYLSNNKLGHFHFDLFDDWEDISVLSKQINEDDIIVFISSRKGTVSYHKFMENLALKLEKFFPLNSKFLVYPQRNDTENKYTEYRDVSSETLTKSITTLKKVGKELRILIQKKKKK
jgi:Kef-type K+ transport system membrane component KefB